MIHQHTECLHCDQLQWLVLDEADSLIHKGYAKELYSIISHIGKKKRQTVLMSATLNEGAYSSNTVYLCTLPSVFKLCQS